jgi:hypothetical protein
MTECKGLTIFEQPWWLDAVAPGQWQLLECEEAGKPAARMMICKKSILGMKVIKMPVLTPFAGPWISQTDSASARLSREKRLMSELIQQIPNCDLFFQKFHHRTTNWLPFHWRGFSQTTHYTYVLDNIQDEGGVWDGLHGNIRREIRKARKCCRLRDDLGIDALLAVNAKTFERQGKRLPYSPQLLRRIDAACAEHQCHKLIFATDDTERIHAALMVVWDQESSYYLIGGADPELRTSGAMSLCMLEAIKAASQHVDRFDFEGSMIEPIERFFRGFGARQIPYSVVTRKSAKARIAVALRDIFAPRLFPVVK